VTAVTTTVIPTTPPSQVNGRASHSTQVGIDPLGSARRILGGRGGYCYHLNGAFSALLAWLGVDVSRHLAGVHGGRALLRLPFSSS